MFAKKELSGLLIFFSFNVIDSMVHLVLFIDRFLSMWATLVRTNWVNLI